MTTSAAEAAKVRAKNKQNSVRICSLAYHRNLVVQDGADREGAPAVVDRGGFAFAALTAGGALSVNVIPAMGMMFMALGCAAFIVPTAWGNWFMVVGFGGLHILFGCIIVRRYGS